ncbi:MAG: TetR/AcrR family transcriptional regulator [Gordonia sp. (in: high G+C Gram-positive bacteria)]|uniref:TetR/AcrR family transcriptional regulator n=1 Tax=Gordonia sp. (in: high G+C Gram-positive bacteria) TaxID=84139 RepID=UPI003BB6F530
MDRERLVDVGVTLISKFGARALSLTSVARQAGVARATAYRMFGGREAFVQAIVQRELAILSEKVATWGADAPDLATCLHIRVTESLKYIRGHEALQYVLTKEPEEVVRALVTTEGAPGPSLIDMIVDATLPDVSDDDQAQLYPNARAGVEFMVRTVYSCMLVPESSLRDDEVAELVVRAIVR